MQVVLNNPYRIVGLLVGATAAEQRRQLTRLQRFLEADQEPDDDFSLKQLGDFDRTVESVKDASSRLSLDLDRMSAALFWFYKGNTITDEPAFEALKEGDLDQVVNIWTKLTSNGEVSQRNASAFSNLASLYLSGVLEGTDSNEALVKQGITLKLKFLESDFIKDFKELATDSTFKTTKKELQLLFLKQLQGESENRDGLTSHQLLDILTKQEFSAKEDFLKDFVSKPIEQIETKIEESKLMRKANKPNAIKAANSLFAETKELIKQLKTVLGSSNIRYSSVADKLAMEYFACGRDYFMHYRDTEKDPSESAMKLFKNARSYAVGSIAKQQIQENIDELEEWIDEKPEREKQEKIAGDLQFITTKIENFQHTLETVANAKIFVEACKPKLINIKSALGATDDFYLQVSTAVATNALGMLISVVNDAQNSFAAQTGDFSGLRSTLRSTLEVSASIGTLDMLAPQKVHYSTNLATLKSIATQLGISSSANNSVATPNSTFSSKPATNLSKPTTSTDRPISSSSGKSDDTWPFFIIGIGCIIGFVSEGVGGLVGGLILSLFLVGIISKIKD